VKVRFHMPFLRLFRNEPHSVKRESSLPDFVPPSRTRLSWIQGFATALVSGLLIAFLIGLYRESKTSRVRAECKAWHGVLTENGQCLQCVDSVEAYVETKFK
jgi:hypothetical protein